MKRRKTQNFKVGEIWNFLLTFVFQILGPNAEICVFWVKKYQLSNLLTKFCLYAISKVLISNLTLIFENLESKCRNLGILGQKVLTFESEQNFEGTLLWMCWIQIWHCFSKILSPNAQVWAFWVKKYQLFNLDEIFLVLYAISKVLISNLTFVFCDF